MVNMFWTKKEQKPLELTEKSYKRLVNLVYCFYAMFRVYDVQMYYAFSAHGFCAENLKELDKYKKENGNYDWEHMIDIDLKAHLKSLDINVLVEKVAKILESYYIYYEDIPTKVTAEDIDTMYRMLEENEEFIKNEKNKKYLDMKEIG